MTHARCGSCKWWIQDDSGIQDVETGRCDAFDTCRSSLFSVDEDDGAVLYDADEQEGGCIHLITHMTFSCSKFEDKEEETE